MEATSSGAQATEPELDEALARAIRALIARATGPGGAQSGEDRAAA